MKKYLLHFILAIPLALIAVVLFTNNVQKTEASISYGNDYQATSTAPNAMYGATTVSINLLKTGQGSLGSVIITGANTGILNFYNATTSNKNKRTGQVATSTILIASFPASIAAGTYVFDVGFTDGLLYVLEAGIMPTTTATFR